MALPDLPASWEEGYDWIEQLSDGWYVVPSWSTDGYDLGSWPYVIVAHYDGNDETPFGVAIYVEGDITVKEFPNREERDHATSETAIFYWSRDDDLPSAPKEIRDGRLGPYRQSW